MGNDSKLRVYLCGQIQHVNDYGKGWRNRLKQDYPDIEWVDPLDKYNTMEEAETEWTAEQVVQDDLDMIADCDAILVHWQETATCGTPMEVFFSKWFPPLADMIWNLAQRLAADYALVDEVRDEWAENAVRGEVSRLGLPQEAADLILAVNLEIPVVVQTIVEGPSPWLTYHADAIVETFDEAVTSLKMAVGYQAIAKRNA